MTDSDPNNGRSNNRYYDAQISRLAEDITALRIATAAESARALEKFRGYDQQFADVKAQIEGIQSYVDGKFMRLETLILGLQEAINSHMNADNQKANAVLRKVNWVMWWLLVGVVMIVLDVVNIVDGRSLFDLLTKIF